MNAINALQLKQVKIVPTLRAMKAAGQEGAVRNVIAVFSKGATGKKKEQLDKLLAAYG
jgi:hypothetical protein